MTRRWRAPQRSRCPMYSINTDEFGELAVLGEFRDIYDAAAGVKVYHTSEKPSIILTELKNDRIIVLHGDYLDAQYLLFYVQKFEACLGSSVELKRKRLHRLSYIAYKSTFPEFENITENYDFEEWLPDIIQNQSYLIPARRYNRILTDINRAAEGIAFDGLEHKIYIRPFVYVPSDKSVPAMFMQFADIICGRTVIDIGTGTGVLAILAAQLGAVSVTAADINKNAADCAENNIRLSGLGNIAPEVVCGDLFENVKNKYDVIIFNAPWVMGEPKNLYESAIYDKDYGLINRFLKQAPDYLEPGGVVLLQYSDISQKNGDGSFDNLYGNLTGNGLYIHDKKSILRKNRLFGLMERVYVFAVKKSK